MFMKYLVNAYYYLQMKKKGDGAINMLVRSR